MLPLNVQKAIEKALKNGGDAKISKDNSGNYHVYEEKVKKVPLKDTSQP